MSMAAPIKNFDAIPPERPVENGHTDEAGEGFEPFVSINRAQPREPFPTDSLPGTMRDAVLAYQEIGGQPLPLVASSSLAALSAAGQGLIDVRRDSQLVGPVSLNVAVVAESGERKTTADKVFSRALREWEKQERERLALDCQQSETALEMWETERKAMFGKLKADLAEDDRTELRSRILAMDESKPRRVVPRRMFYEDVNEASLSVALAEGWPSAALWSDEAGLVIGSRGMADENVLRFLALMNRLWDGANPTRRDRNTTKSSEIIGRRLTVSLMMQSTVFGTLMSNAHTRGIGYLARCLLCEPESTIGGRIYKEPPERMPELDRFNVRIGELLNLPLPTVGSNLELDPPAVPLSSEAKAVWEDFLNTVEVQLGDGGDLEEVKDIASKSADNAVRLAALFQLFETGGIPEAVGQDCMVHGAFVAEWYLGEAKRLLLTHGASPRHVAALKIWAFLLRRHRETGALHVTTRDLGQKGPGRLRTKPEWEPPVQLLEAHGYLRRTKGVLNLNPEAVANG